MWDMNVFRIVADLSHVASKCILIYAIHWNRSAEGVSVITQALYALVFLTRYLDIFLPNTLWNTSFKIFYIFTSIYILFLMLRVYARTRERERSWTLGASCLVISLVLAPIMMMIFKKTSRWGFHEVAWTFSIILESFCVLPQLLLLRQTTVPTVINSYYLAALGAYRALYIVNWAWREEFDVSGRKPDPTSVIFGVIQTAFYLDFAWVYYSRQRVKLRGGGIVDADDMRKGWLIGRIFAHKPIVGDVEDAGPGAGTNGDSTVPARSGNSKWGSRGISVSADTGLLESEPLNQGDFVDQEEGIVNADEDAELRASTEAIGILDDDDEDGISPGSRNDVGVGNGSEWREGVSAGK